jgi:hypothetical protein
MNHPLPSPASTLRLPGHEGNETRAGQAPPCSHAPVHMPPGLPHTPPCSLLSSCANFLPCVLKAKFLNRLAQPINGWAIVNFPAGFDQKRGCFGPWRQGNGFTQRCKFRVMLESPVHIDPATLAIFNVVFIYGSTLWALCHRFPPLQTLN